jgi:two-component system chemotaxis response regulator CheB
MEYGSAATGLIMTGMGEDGAEGIGEIMGRGGVTVAQDEGSCVVFGMPKAAIDRKYIAHVVSLEDMGDFLPELFMRKENAKWDSQQINLTQHSNA